MQRCTSLLMALACASTAAVAADAESFGIAASAGTVTCASFPGVSASAVRRVRVVLLQTPQTILSGTLSPVPSQVCSAMAKSGVTGPYYRLQLDHGADFSRDLGIVVPETGWSLDVRGPVAEAKGRGRARVTFRSCNTREGVHLTAWSGDALEGQRVWHGYYPLGYDVEPSCQRKDYE